MQSIKILISANCKLEPTAEEEEKHKFQIKNVI